MKRWTETDRRRFFKIPNTTHRGATSGVKVRYINFDLGDRWLEIVDYALPTADQSELSIIWETEREREREKEKRTTGNKTRVAWATKAIENLKRTTHKD